MLSYCCNYFFGRVLLKINQFQRLVSFWSYANHIYKFLHVHFKFWEIKWGTQFLEIHWKSKKYFCLMFRNLKNFWNQFFRFSILFWKALKLLRVSINNLKWIVKVLIVLMFFKSFCDKFSKFLLSYLSFLRFT